MSEHHESTPNAVPESEATEPQTDDTAPLAMRPKLGARIAAWLKDYATAPIDTWQLMLPLMVLSIVLYTRLPTTNYIFDEQEALLANPYVNKMQGLRFIDAIHRDFWGLLPDRSIGSYRPIPNFLWRILWTVSKQPFFHHFYNVLFHALNASVLALFAHKVTQRRDVAWMTGAIFCACAVLTEAVSGIVGIADVLGGLGAVLALLALIAPVWAMPFAVFSAVLFGLFSKESALVCVPLVPFAALLLAPLTHPRRPLRLLRALVALVAAAGAFLLYVELRRRWFPSPLPQELETPLPEGASRVAVWARKALVWFHQAPLPKDPLNNPLTKADTPHRVAGALRVYFRGLEQLVVPYPLSGDYSYPQEPIPDRLVFPESVLGALGMVLPVASGVVLYVAGLMREARERKRVLSRGEAPFSGAISFDVASLLVIAVGLVWIVVSYFPHSNIPVVLPTVRAERFWYFPAIGSSLVFAVVFARLDEMARSRSLNRIIPMMFGVFMAAQCVAAYRHATHYRDDLAFWEATKNAVPRSAKAHLNFSVMKGARGDLETRLSESRIAMDLAPEWPMAHVYTADTLCRQHRGAEAWPHYKKGFELGPNELSLIALGLQCLFDEHELDKHDAELRELAYEEQFKGTWIAYLAIDTLDNGVKNKGVDPQYRPRGYNEGPKESASTSDSGSDTASASASASAPGSASAGAADAADEP